ncbi:MAG: TIGR02302 family protein, partial [Rhizobiaceae bacterium]
MGCFELKRQTQNEVVNEQDNNSGTERLATTRALAWLAEMWERLWPRLLPMAFVVSLFLTVSWLGLWPAMGPVLQTGLLVLFSIGALATLYPLRTLTLPQPAEVDTRIERVSRLEHRPVTAQKDRPAGLAGNDDPFAKALWEEHRRRMAGKLDGLRPGTPNPKISQRDPYALRSIMALLLFVAFAAGWGDWSSRIGDAFRNHSNTQQASTGRIDAWLTPPAYTNRPPIFLAADTNTVTVPEGSELVVRFLGVIDPSVSLIDAETGSVEPVAAALEDTNKTDKIDQDAGAQSQTFKATLKQTGTIDLVSAGRPLRQWAVTVLADDDPIIRYEEDPTASARGTLEFAYSVEDDYRVVAARAEILQADPKAEGAEPLIEAPDIALSLPSRNARDGVTRSSQDLTAHPWAGAEVEMTLIAEDEAGQTGRSETRTFILPERIFTKPLALAVVEERRKLALDANAARDVAEMLDIITDTHPDEFIKDVSVFTALRVAFRTIQRNTDHNELRGALDLLWETALAIEDGDLSLAERRLRDAQERLSQALENGASDEEIDELMKELRAAMDAFMRELAEQMSRNPQNQQAMPLDPNTQMLRQQDLDRLMQQIED